MNGNRSNPSDDDPVDPELLQLFDAAPEPSGRDAFVSAVLLRMQQTRRAWLVSRGAALALILVLGAFIAPYAALLTLRAAAWLTDPAPTTAIASLLPLAGCLCAALITWRIAHRS